MTGENLQEQLNKINSFLPGFFGEEETETTRKKASRKGRENAETKPKIARGRNTYHKRSTNKVTPETQRKVRYDTHRNSKTDNRCTFLPHATSAMNCQPLPHLGLHPFGQFIGQPNGTLIPVGVNMAVNREQIARTLNRLSVGVPLGHVAQHTDETQMRHLPGFHGVPNIAFHNGGSDHTVTETADTPQNTQQDGGAYYTTFYYKNG